MKLGTKEIVGREIVRLPESQGKKEALVTFQAPGDGKS